MTCPRTLFKATALAAPLGLLALGAHAGDIVGTIQEQEQFSKFAEAIEAAGMSKTLEGQGPYTIFAPTDQAFDQLPQGALDELMKEENRDQLETLLQYHVVEGEEITTKDAVGTQTEVDTLAGDSLSVDGSGQLVLLVPTGLTVTRVGDQVIVERDVAAVPAPAVEVAPTPSQPGQQDVTRTEVTRQSDMPASEHQQQALGTDPATEQQQTSPQTGIPATPHQEQLLPGDQEAKQQQALQPQESRTTGQMQEQSGQQDVTRTEVTRQTDMPASEHQQQALGTDPATEHQQTSPQAGIPATPHQEQLLPGDQEAKQQQAVEQPQSGTTGQIQQQSKQQTEVTRQTDMPASEHQQQVLREEPSTEQQQTAPQGTDMPSSPHQEQVLRGEQQQMAGQSGSQQGKGILREATVVEPDIEADNGVIHAIDAVLVPQSVLSRLESMRQDTQSQGQQQSKAKQG